MRILVSLSLTHLDFWAIRYFLQFLSNVDVVMVMLVFIAVRDRHMKLNIRTE